jgi:hypothetical protein
VNDPETRGQETFASVATTLKVVDACPCFRGAGVDGEVAAFNQCREVVVVVRVLDDLVVRVPLEHPLEVNKRRFMRTPTLPVR